MTIHNVSVGRGSVMGLDPDKACCAERKTLVRFSSKLRESGDCIPEIALSRGSIIEAQSGRTRPRTLYEPMNERMSLTVVGRGHEDRTEIR